MILDWQPVLRDHNGPTKSLGRYPLNSPGSSGANVSKVYRPSEQHA